MYFCAIRRKSRRASTYLLTCQALCGIIYTVKCSDYPLLYRVWVKARCFSGQKSPCFSLSGVDFLSGVKSGTRCFSDSAYNHKGTLALTSVSLPRRWVQKMAKNQKRRKK